MKTFRRRPRDPHAHPKPITEPEILRRRALVIETAEADARGAAQLRDLADFIEAVRRIGARARLRQ